MSYEKNCLIKRGLPVTIAYEITPADHSVGIFYDEVNPYNIVAIKGKRKNCDWLWNKLTKFDIADICEQLNEPEW